MTNPPSNIGAPQDPRDTLTDTPSTVAGKKRKVSHDKAAEENVQGSAQLKSSKAKNTKRAKLNQQDGDVTASTLTQPTKITKKSNNQDAAGGSHEKPDLNMVDALPPKTTKPRKKKATPSGETNSMITAAAQPKKRQLAKKAKTQEADCTSGEGQNVNMADAPEEQPVLSSKTSKPRKTKAIPSADGDSTNTAAAQSPKKRQPVKKAQMSRSKKSKNLSPIHKDGDQDMEGDDGAARFPALDITGINLSNLFAVPLTTKVEP
jgi:hypothetical protein